MAKRIMVSSEESISCPNCNHKFPLHEGITKQTIEGYEKEYDTLLEERTEELKSQLAKEAVKSAQKAYTTQISSLKEELEDAREALQEVDTRAKKKAKQAAAKAREEFEEEKKSLVAELEDKKTAIKEFRQNELALRKEKEKLEEDRRNFALEHQRKLDEAKQEIEKKTREAEADKFKYKEAEYQKKLDAAMEANKELARKLEQGSQQLQGEVMELELERILRQAFPTDNVEEIAKGVRGADVRQGVISQTGQICGTIIWETKRAQNWSDKWLQKLKDDRLASNADIGVIVTTVLPKDCREPFMMIGDVWVISDKVVRPVAETLRVILVETNKLKFANTGRAEKAELVYNYLCSTNFAQNIRSVIETFSSMKQDLDKEKNAMYRMWKKRESQLERVAFSMSTTVGELQAITKDSLPQLNNIDQLLLPGETETEQ